MAHYTFLESFPTVADDVVCDPLLYDTGSGDQSRAYKSLPTHRLSERIQGHNPRVKYPSGLDTRSVGKTNDYVVRSGPYTEKRVV